MKEITPVTLLPDTVFSELSDSSFVPSRIACMATVGDEVYFSDYPMGKVLSLDANYNIKKEIGSKGQGPGELLSAAHFYTKGRDSIYILDEVKGTLEHFVNGKHIETKSFPKDVRLTNNTRFFVRDHNAFHSVIAEKSPVFILNDNVQESKFICDYSTYDRMKFSLHSTRHVLESENGFFLIGCVLPVLQQYSFDGELCGEYDLKQIPEVEQVTKIYNSTPQIPTSYFTMIQDVYYYNHKLYLLIGTSFDKQYTCNTICVLDVAGEIEHISTFKLSGGPYTSFCIGQDNIVFAGSMRNASIEVFSMQ